ncbi:MAG: hypothetical protein M3177_08885 [Pseudomonadota bacterium]|nr:hypothetical protein [Pseudomonadota bacterium]
MRFLNPIVRRCCIVRLTATAIAAPAALVQRQDPEPTFYMCGASRTGPFGHIWYGMDVPVDGSARFHRITWTTPRRAEGLSLSATWMGPEPVGGLWDDRGWVSVTFSTTRRIRDRVRLEVRRRAGAIYPEQFAYAGPFKRMIRDGPLSIIHAQGQWDELKVWMSGWEALTFALVRRNGTVMAEDHLDATTLAAVDAAIAAVRPDIEAIAADYRDRCRVPGPIYMID